MVDNAPTDTPRDGERQPDFASADDLPAVIALLERCIRSQGDLIATLIRERDDARRQIEERDATIADLRERVAAADAAVARDLAERQRVLDMLGDPRKGFRMEATDWGPPQNVPHPTPAISGETRYVYRGEKPTIYELEEILEREGNDKIHIEPDGSLTVDTPQPPADLVERARQWFRDMDADWADTRNSHNNTYWTYRAERLATALAAERAAATRRDALAEADKRLPHGWWWKAKRFRNLPGCHNGYAEVHSPHVDDGPWKEYGATPSEALHRAIDRALSPDTTDRAQGGENG